MSLDRAQAHEPIEQDSEQLRSGSRVPITVSGSYWIELAPVLVAARYFLPEPLEVGRGGIPRITAGEVDLATNAETQLLRESMKNPDLRVIMTVSEGFMRIVARRSSGIETLADLRGKRIVAQPNTSAHYFLAKMLETVGIGEDDVDMVRITALINGKRGYSEIPGMLERGEVDAIATWEPEPVTALELLGDDAVVFEDREVYREVFNLHARAQDLADAGKRASIVEFVRAVAAATEALARNPAEYFPHISEITGFTLHEIEESWPELGFPVHIVPDLLDLLEREDVWAARELDRAPRSRDELAKLIDASVLEEALAR
jgi:sulfonate transport system substrate-binding protein